MIKIFYSIIKVRYDKLYVEYLFLDGKVDLFFFFWCIEKMFWKVKFYREKYRSEEGLVFFYVLKVYLYDVFEFKFLIVIKVFNLKEAWLWGV